MRPSSSPLVCLGFVALTLLAITSNFSEALLVPLNHVSTRRTTTTISRVPIPQNQYTRWNSNEAANVLHAVKDQKNSQIGNKIKLPWCVGGVYGVLGICALCGVHFNTITPKEVAIAFGMLWSGFVLAISFMEAWVKFRAPFLPRHYGLDVGRTIFPVLNAIEVALCGTLCALKLFMKNTLAWSSLGVATTILISQVLYLTPKLVLMGKHVIYDAFPEAQPTWNERQKQLFESLAKEVHSKPRPPSKLHLVYVVGELFKIIALAKFVWIIRNLSI